MGAGQGYLWTCCPLEIAEILLPWLPVFAQAVDDTVLLITTNGVLEDQFCSVPIPKQKWNRWEQRQQFYKLSCCSGPLKAPQGGSSLAVLWEGKHPAKFVSGQTTFSSLLITKAIAFRLSGGLLTQGMHPAVGFPFLWLGLSGQGRKSWRNGESPSWVWLLSASFTWHCRAELTSPALLKQLHCDPEHGTTLGLSSWTSGRGFPCMPCAYSLCEFSQAMHISPF